MRSESQRTDDPAEFSIADTGLSWRCVCSRRWLLFLVSASLLIEDGDFVLFTISLELSARLRFSSNGSRVRLGGSSRPFVGAVLDLAPVHDRGNHQPE